MLILPSLDSQCLPCDSECEAHLGFITHHRTDRFSEYVNGYLHKEHILACGDKNCTSKRQPVLKVTACVGGDGRYG